MIRVESPRDRVNVAKIYEAGQEQIFEYWDELTPDQRRSLLDQVAGVDFTEFNRLVRTHVLADDEELGPGGLGELRPAEMISLPHTPAQLSRAARAREIGLEALARGEVGAFLVAGGQGTRLSFDGPKGLYPIGPITGRTLFAFMAEKLLVLQRRVRKPIPWYIMTSATNHEATIQHFQEHGFFGLQRSDVQFLPQRMLPVVDPRRGKILLQSPWQIALSPTGHGGAIAVMQDIIESLEQRGIRYLFTHQVDNPLVRMCDPVFLGHHIEQNSGFSSKAAAKRAPEEKVGVFCQVGDECRVIEYTELGEEEAHARDEDGALRFRAGNIAQHVVSVDFIHPERDGDSFQMPYHVAKKSIPVFRDGEPQRPDGPNSVRFESFLFDVLPAARNPVVMEIDRALEFGPVKNPEGEDSPATCRELMAEEWAIWLEESGHPPARDERGALRARLEISPLFADSSEVFAARAKDLDDASLAPDEDLLLE